MGEKKKPKLFNPQKGDRVAVCYDGKTGRAVEGVVKMHRGFALLVEFTEWVSDDSEGALENWFVRTSPHAFGGYLRKERSLMRMMVGTPGDWYSVYSEKYLTGDANSI